MQHELGDVDVIGFCVPANEKIGPGDRCIDEQLEQYPRAKKVAIVTKTDAASRDQVAEQLLGGRRAARDWAAIIPRLGARRGEQLDVLTDELLALMPIAEPALYPAGRRHRRVRRGPHRGAHPRGRARGRRATSCRTRSRSPIDDMVEREDKDLVEIYANLFVERDSQKAIIIGHKGGRACAMSAPRARAQIEPLVGTQVFLVAAREGREGVAARPEAARPARVLRRTTRG